jgi:ubiquinone/menaquinone biosynthesis C-methylase UbiE
MTSTTIIKKNNLSYLENIYVKQTYEKIAPHFNVTRVYIWTWVDDFINSVPKGSFIYDIGCGNGRNMQNPHYTFIGIDNCENFVEMCTKNKQLAILSDMTNINLPDNSADAIICIATFHHLSLRENHIKALYEIKRLIKPNGKILISVWSIDQPKKTRITFDKYGDTFVRWNHKYIRYYYIFKIDEILNLFRIVGLKVIQHKYDCGNEIFILKL